MTRPKNVILWVDPANRTRVNILKQTYNLKSVNEVLNKFLPSTNKIITLENEKTKKKSFFPRF